MTAISSYVFRGKQGIQGEQGEAGQTILSGTAVPDSGTGANGDFYLRTSTSDLYGPKTDSGWGSPTSLIGAQGPAGESFGSNSVYTASTPIPSQTPISLVASASMTGYIYFWGNFTFEAGSTKDITLNITVNGSPTLVAKSQMLSNSVTIAISGKIAISSTNAVNLVVSADNYADSFTMTIGHLFYSLSAT